MTYSPSDFGPGKSGPQFALLDERLTLHGYPSLHALDTPKNRTQRFQLAQGWRGTELGGDADGYVGPETWRRLLLDPPEPVPEPVPSGIDESIWKITFPVADEGDDDDDDGPLEWFPINEREYAPYFVRNDDGTLTFRAPVDGVTTSKSGYPRTEFREMDEDGNRAAWSSRTGTHRMRGRFRVTELPDGKDEVVPAQIHDDIDDVVMIVVSGSDIFLSESKGPGQGSNRRLIATGYKLGDWVDFEFLATRGGIKTTVNGHWLNTSRVVDDAYFKAGCYSQANEDNGSGAAEVDYENLEVQHD